jgi:hypothetical protein
VANLPKGKLKLLFGLKPKEMLLLLLFSSSIIIVVTAVGVDFVFVFIVASAAAAVTQIFVIITSVFCSLHNSCQCCRWHVHICRIL